MALLQWTDNFSVKVKQLDDQHKKLIEVVNSLHEAMRGGKSKEVIGGVLQQLMNYAKEHFSSEENLLIKAAYPQMAVQKSEHQAFIKWITDVKTRFDKGDMVLGVEIMDFLQKWWTNHILKSDKGYSEHLNKRGIV